MMATHKPDAVAMRASPTPPVIADAPAPDRYLDGIRSFTFGAGYVPRKDLLLEAFYTFDAKGTNKRDTLYGSESFKLGDYTRIQGTYRF